MVELPRDFPVLERDIVRMVVRDTADRILLFHEREQSAPSWANGGRRPEAASMRAKTMTESRSRAAAPGMSCPSAACCRP